ncbi:hypothetical protein DPMN_013529 [Dreissena polymorpha]|uniref:Uncharacterized protein n=1 Tax=Dreissena polymorpha TaxID=45954 RepID=A0A9D4N4E6_DREPO|nr:hypothetical protein DPMN_013529 [Dreissena polymorpha]
MTDEVFSVWTRNGAIFFKNVQDQVTRVNFEDYQTWQLWPIFQTMEVIWSRTVQNQWVENRRTLNLQGSVCNAYDDYTYRLQGL